MPTQSRRHGTRKVRCDGPLAGNVDHLGKGIEDPRFDEFAADGLFRNREDLGAEGGRTVRLEGRYLRAERILNSGDPRIVFRMERADRHDRGIAIVKDPRFELAVVAVGFRGRNAVHSSQARSAASLRAELTGCTFFSVTSLAISALP